MSQDFDVDVEDPEVEEEDRLEFQEPKMFSVLFMNDDYTPMNFVTDMLMQYHGKSEEQATAIMLDVHEKGMGVAGIYTSEIAETKVYIVNQLAEKSGYPLKTVMQEN